MLYGNNKSDEKENGKDLLVLTVYHGRSTPYYYKADGITEAYIRIGNESVIAPDYVLNQLLLKGMNLQEGATTMERNRQIGGHKA